VIPQLPNPKDGYGKGLHHNKKIVIYVKLVHEYSISIE
jgi:hypothetical protein